MYLSDPIAGDVGGSSPRGRPLKASAIFQDTEYDAAVVDVAT